MACTYPLPRFAFHSITFNVIYYGDLVDLEMSVCRSCRCKKNIYLGVRPVHSTLTTALLADLVIPNTLIYSPRGPHLWSTYTISKSVCSGITSDPNPGYTTITHETIGRFAGLMHEKRKLIHAKEEEETGGWKKPRTYSNILVTQIVPKELPDIQRRKQSCRDMLEKTLSKTRDHVPVSISGPARILRINKNHQVLVEATQEVGKMLPELGGSLCVIALKILLGLSSSELVLLSYATVIDTNDPSPTK
ncbi:uncharacterized protein RSE6_00839 [Rhynchosporium secalis]|uniref:Uncharacterized protein n=1 Tax=Rhynchosporium secalis TaxID=38038 RepID=A0A1E1LW96_RHYSE|nr:uncharacterized protein RSE6_00839 [Rhynchosporium secalis]